MSQPLIIAHRGDSHSFPENTMEAFESAFKKGADGIELDIHELDGKLLVVHNYTFDRSKEYLELNDVLEKFAGKGRIEVEVKSIGLGFIGPLQETLSRYPGADIEITTSVAGLISYIRPNFPDFKMGTILPRGEFEPWMAEEGFLVPKIVSLLQLYKSDIVHLYHDFVTQEVVDAVHALGIKVHSHIHAQPPEQELALYKKLTGLGVDQMTVDDIGIVSLVRS